MNNTWKIFVNGQPTVERAVVHELEYHGEWMEEEYVSVTVKSATPIDFHYGDHLYYRGVKFEINYDPNFIKKASSGSYGEGFTYDNIKLYPVSARLKDVAFKDVVLNDPQTPANAIVYSSLGTFSFFAGSVEDLADRIMANLNRDYNGEWRVYTPYKARSIQRNGSIGAWGQYYNGDGGTIEGKTEMNIECQNLSVLDALKLAYTSFDLSFYVTGKVIVIGGKPIVADYEFEYGKGNGLYEIERTHDESQRIVTKLYAYGSDRNLPLNYYANIGKKVKIPIVHKTKREILQGNPELVLWVNKEFTKSLRDAFGPNYEVKLTYGNLSARFGVSGDTYTYAQEQDDDTLNHTTEYMMFWALSDNTDALAFYNTIAAGTSVYVTGVNINQMPSDFIETPSSYSYDAALSITKLMLPGFPTQSLFAWVAANGAININYITGRATWHGYTAYFSMNASDPWIKSVKADEIGVREGTVEFDSSSDTEIYPTIEGTGFDKVNWCEQIDDNGHIDEELTFKLMPQSVDGSDGDIEWDYGGVSISMKDGYCVGREFEVAEAKYNTDTSLWELTMKRKKDDSLGVYFPYKSGSGNLYQILGSGNLHDPDHGDHFVVLGIPLPSTYVNLAASKLLEEALKELAKIDHQSYTYIPRIDEIEMTRQHDLAMASQGTITSIHDTICAGMQMQIDDDDLNLHYTPFIDNITIKEAGNNGIPTYDVVLRDEKEMTMQQRIQSQIDGGKDAIINALGGEGGEWLSRVSDDTAQGMITFLRGLQVGENFVTGLLGEGGVFRVEDDGTTYIEADKLYIRMKAYFDSVEIREYHHTGGNRIASVAGARCCRVEWIDSQGDVLEKTQANLSSVVKFRCYFMGNDGDDEVRNNWVVGDLAYCHITTVQTDDDSPEAKGLNMKHYWRKVVGRNATGTLTVKGEHWIDLSNVSGEFQSGSDIPEAQDDIIQLGNVNDTDRQGAIIEFVTGADAPSYQIFQGINSFSLTGKNYVRFGYDSQSGGAQAFIGNPDGSTYLWYHRVTEGGVTFPRLDIKANVKFTSPTTHQETNIEDFATAVTDSIEDLQEQIDGEIDTWFYEGTPTLNNAPASDWTTATEKERHLGDLYYDIGTGATGGFAYRFIKDENNVYQWQYLEDTAITEALAKAAEAYDLADHKRRVFYTTPTPPYDNGDLWVNAVWPDSGASQGSTYNDDILRCVTSKAAGGTFAIGDWTLASNYTDDSALVDFVTNTYAQDLVNIETQVDAKAETWYQDSDPSSAWTDDDTKSAHVGDIWYDTSASGGKKTYIWRDRGAGHNPRYYWAEQAVPDVVFDDIDGKAAIYVTWNGWIVDNVNKLNDKDLFIPAADVTPTGSSVTYKANKVYRWDENSSVWREIAYTDDAVLNNFMNVTYANDKQNLQSQIDGKAETWRQTTDPANAWTTADEKAAHVGDLWMDTSTNGGKKTYIYQNTGTSLSPVYEWVAQDVPDTVFDEIDGKSSIFVTQPSNYKANDLWILAADTTVNGVAYKQGEVLTATQDSETYNQAHWIKKVCYTDDTIVNEIIAKYGQIMNIGSPTAEGVGQAIGLLNGILKNSNTQIDGGLILTSAIYMKDTGLSPSIWAGISGVRQSTETGSAGKGWKGYGVAAWYGGGVSSSIPIDKECLTATEIADGWNGNTYHLRWARGLDRFDGSGYRADGNISWDASGNVTIQGTTINAATLTKDGSAVLVEGALDDYYTKTEADARYVTIDFFKRLFQAYSSENIIDANKVNPNDLTTTISNIKAMFGLWTESYLSALGLNSSGGSGSGLDEEAMWTALWNDTGTYGGRQINASHLSYVLNDYATKAWVQTQISGSSFSITPATTTTLGGVLVKRVNSSALTFEATTEANRNYPLQIDSNNVAYVNIPWTDTNTTYSAATTNALGLIKVHSSVGSAVTLEAAGTTDNRNYGVQLDSNSKAFVCVPWTDTNTTYSSATTVSLGLVKVSKAISSSVPTPSTEATENKYYGLQIDSNGVAFVNVPWTDTNTTYSVFSGATTNADGTSGLVKAPLIADRGKYLRGDGQWGTPVNTTYSDFVGSGATAQHGLVPAPPTTAGTSKYLREDGTWVAPPNTTYNTMSGASASAAGTSGLVPTPAKGNQGLFLRGDATWATPTNTTYSSATTSALGLLKVSNKLNTSQNLTESAGTTANRFYGVQMDSNGVAFVNVPWTDTNTTYTFTDNNPTLAWSTKSKVATIGGVAINVTMPANPASNRLPLSGGTLTGFLGYSDSFLIKPVADYRTKTNTHTGCITITIPAAVGNTMVSMWIDVYNYRTNTSFSVHCGGYTYTKTTWANSPFAIVYGAKHRVRFGRNNTSFIIYIGEINSTWSFPQVTVRDVMLGFDNATAYSTWTGNWSITFSTSVSNVTADITRYGIVSGYTFGAASSSDAGTSGLVPAPPAGAQGYYLRGDGSWASPTNTTYSAATTSALGLLKVSNKLSSSQNLTESAGTTANRFYGVQMDSNGVAFVNVPWSDTNTTYTFTDNNPTLAWSTKSKVATVGGVAINVTMPANPNTDSKTSSSASNSSFLYLVGALTQSTSGVTTYTNSGCYIGTDGLLYSGTNKVLYNSTDFCVKDGQVGIGTNSPAYKFDVVGNAQFGGNTNGAYKIRIGSTSTSASISMCDGGGTSRAVFNLSTDSSNNVNGSIFYSLRALSGSTSYMYGYNIILNTNGSERLRISSGGIVSINSSTPGSSYRFYVNGACAGSSWTNVSDMRKKNFIENKSVELWQIANAPIFKFTWKDVTLGTDIHVGTSAQYWQTIVPEAVTTDGNGYFGLQYDVVALLAAITTAKKVQDHEARIQALERENAYLKNELKRLT